MPKGRSRWGFLVSWAAVETASNPIYAKNTRAAPRMIPEKPKWPWLRSGGMNGCQLAVWMYGAQKTMNINTTASLIMTMTALKRADSLIPRTNITVITSVISMAGMLSTAPVEWN